MENLDSCLSDISKEKFTIKVKVLPHSLKEIMKVEKPSFKDKLISRKSSMINKRIRVNKIRSSLRTNNRNKSKTKDSLLI